MIFCIVPIPKVSPLQTLDFVGILRIFGYMSSAELQTVIIRAPDSVTETFGTNLVNKHFIVRNVALGVLVTAHNVSDSWTTAAVGEASW